MTTKSSDKALLIAVFVITLAVSLVAAYLPAHRINHIDPAIVFRA